MDHPDLLQMFRSMASEIAEKDFAHANEDSVIAELGMDSLAMLELVGALERQLEIRIADEKLAGVQTVRQLLQLIADHRAQLPPAPPLPSPTLESK